MHIVDREKGESPVRRLAYLFAGATLWLFVAAIPAFADGGPHVQNNNSGAGGLAADCAGCHRAHSAQTDKLLISEGTALCVTCHGSAGTGAATNVADGVQYTLASRVGTTGTPVLGALRGGGFQYARIGSSTPTRIHYTSKSHDFFGKVPVLADGAPVTSKHMSLDAEAAGMAWGNGPNDNITVNPGVSVTLECTSCHNPHGNGQYRILVPKPKPEGTGFIQASADALVTDAALPPASDARNYTVIQTMGGTGTLLQSQVAGVVPSGPTSLAGDYWRRKVPWNVGTSGGYDYDAPNGIGGSSSTAGSFTYQMNAWCITCHTRYPSTGPGDGARPDLLFKFQHSTDGSKPCIVCHVAHGSNALMTPDTGSYNMKNPDGTTPTTAGDSRLLKVDNRGTCQLCHDPTGTAPVAPAAGSQVGPTPAPIVP
jgi:predicted CXXCH cytochrome family protein